jgi:rRNA processing protein Gar1
MQPIGVALHLSKSGKLVVKGTLTPKAGRKLYDEKGAEVGRAVEVFGPIKTPYISVRLAKGVDSEALLKQKIFIR